MKVVITEYEQFNTNICIHTLNHPKKQYVIKHKASNTITLGKNMYIIHVRLEGHVSLLNYVNSYCSPKVRKSLGVKGFQFRLFYPMFSQFWGLRI